MNERAKITASHFARQAIVYLRQSSPAQVEHNRESTQRQYALANRACELGWSNEHIVVIDEDLGLSGSGSVARSVASDLFLDWRCRVSLAIMPTGTASSSSRD